MTALVPIFVAVLNAVVQLGPKVMEFIAQVRAHPSLDPKATVMLDGLQKNIEGHVDYLDKREPLTPNAPTHRCKFCGARWRLNPAMPPDELKAKGYAADGPFSKPTWSLVSEKCGPCCDNVAMGDQIELLSDPDPTPRQR